MAMSQLFEMVIPFLPDSLVVQAKGIVGRLQALSAPPSVESGSRDGLSPPLSNQVFALLPSLFEIFELLVRETVANPERGARLFAHFFSLLSAALALFEEWVIKEEHVDKVLTLLGQFLVSLQEPRGADPPQPTRAALEHLEKVVHALIESATKRDV